MSSYHRQISDQIRRQAERQVLGRVRGERSLKPLMSIAPSRTTQAREYGMGPIGWTVRQYRLFKRSDGFQPPHILDAQAFNSYTGPIQRSVQELDETGEVVYQVRGDQTGAHAFCACFQVRVLSRSARSFNMPISGNSRLYVEMKRESASSPTVLAQSPYFSTGTVHLNLPAGEWVTISIYAYFDGAVLFRAFRGLTDYIDQWSDLSTIEPSQPSYTTSGDFTQTTTGYLDPISGASYVDVNIQVPDLADGEDLTAYGLYRYRKEDTTYRFGPELNPPSDIQENTIAPYWNVGVVYYKRCYDVFRPGTDLYAGDTLIGTVVDTVRVPTNAIQFNGNFEDSGFTNWTLYTSGTGNVGWSGSEYAWGSYSARGEGDGTDLAYLEPEYYKDDIGQGSLLNYVNVDEDRAPYTVRFWYKVLEGQTPTLRVYLMDGGGHLLRTDTYETPYVEPKESWKEYSVSYYPYSEDSRDVTFPEGTERMAVRIWLVVAPYEPTDNFVDGVTVSYPALGAVTQQSPFPRYHDGLEQTWVRLDQTPAVESGTLSFYEFDGMAKEILAPSDIVDVPAVAGVPGSGTIRYVRLRDTDVQAGETYVYSVDAVGRQGTRATKLALTDPVEAGDTEAPDEVSGISTTAGPNSVTIKWTNPADEDFQGVNIYEDSKSSANLLVTVPGLPGEKGSATITGLVGGVEATFVVTTFDRRRPQREANESDGSAPFSETPEWGGGLWAQNGNDIYNLNSGGVVVGGNTAGALLDVQDDGQETFTKLTRVLADDEDVYLASWEQTSASKTYAWYIQNAGNLVLRDTGASVNIFEVYNGGAVFRGSSPQVLIEATGTSAANLAQLNLEHSDSGPEAGNYLGAVNYVGTNSAPADVTYVTILGISDTITAGAEIGELQFLVQGGAGSQVNTLTLVGGKVAIGHTNPAEELDVLGDFKVSGTTTLNTVEYTWPAADGGAGEVLSTDAGGGLSWIAGAADGDWSIDGVNHYVYNTTDDIGIGTATPGYLLHVSDGASGTLASLIEHTHASGWGLRIETTSTASNQAALDVRSAGGASQFLWVGNNGNVGIGTATPLTHLHVEGASAGAVSLPTYYNTVVVEDGTTSGITILALSYCGIQFGDAGDNDIGAIRYAHTDNAMRFDTNASQKMIIDSSGNVGMGASSPSSYTFDNLVVYETGANPGITIACGTSEAGYLCFADGTTGSENYRGAVAYEHASDLLYLIASGGAMATLNSNGMNLYGTPGGSVTISLKSSTPAVGIGTNNPTNGLLEVYDEVGSVAPGYFRYKGGTATSIDRIGWGFRQETHRSDAAGSFWAAYKSRSGSSPGYTIVQDDDLLLDFRIYGADGSAWQQAASIKVEVDGTPGASDMPARMSFWVTPDGSDTPVERVTILSGGNVGIGTVSPDNQLHILNASGNATAKIETTDAGSDAILTLKSGSSDDNWILFSDGGANPGAITYAHSTDALGFYTNGTGTPKAAISSDGSFYIYGVGDLYLQAETPTLDLDGDATTTSVAYIRMRADRPSSGDVVGSIEAYNKSTALAQISFVRTSADNLGQIRLTTSGTLRSTWGSAGGMTMDSGGITVTSGNIGITTGDLNLVNGDVNLSSGNISLTSSGSTLVTVTSTSSDPILNPPGVKIYHNDSSPSAGQMAGFIAFYANNSTPASMDVCDFVVTVPTITASSEVGKLVIRIINGGSLGDRLRLYGDGHLDVDASSGEDAATVGEFDEFDDPPEVERLIKNPQEAHPKVRKAICSVSSDGREMWGLQPLLRLMGGGIYQVHNRLVYVEGWRLTVERWAQDVESWRSQIESWQQDIQRKTNKIVSITDMVDRLGGIEKVEKGLEMMLRRAA